MRLLASLVDKSLIEVIQTDDSARYVLLESVRTFALNQLDRSKLQTSTARRHAEWLARIADTIPRSTPEFFTEIAPELENARSALAWAINSTSEDDHALGGRIISGLRNLWMMSGRRSELRRMSVAWLACIDEAKFPDVAAKILLTYIFIAFNEPGVFDAIERAIPLFDRIGDTRAIISLHSILTFIFASSGRLADARRAAERVEALSATEKTQMSHEYAVFLSNRAMLREVEGRFDEARADLAAAETILTSFGDDFLVVNKLKIRQIFVEYGVGNIRRAIEIANEMLASEYGTNPEIVHKANECLACLYLLLGEPDAARPVAKVVLNAMRADETLVVQYVAGIAALGGHPHVAARLMGYVDALLERVPSQRDLLQQRAWELLCTSLAEQLHPDVLVLRRAEGARLDAQAAGAEALAALALH
jgi:hypothetical protein